MSADDPAAAGAAIAEGHRRGHATTSPWCWAPAGAPPPTSSATPDHELAMADLPGFRPPAVAGHGGTVRSVPVGERRVLVLLGRTHLYEGHGVGPVAHGVRTAAAAGCRTVVLTNAAGGIREGMHVGEPGADLRPPQPDRPLAARRPALHRPHRPLLARGCARCAREIDPTLTEGVYAGLPGPHFETPAEIRMLRGLGADLVGMSTVLEAIAARAEGVEVFGLSLVTNLAAGMTGEPLDHHEVLAAGAAVGGADGGAAARPDRRGCEPASRPARRGDALDRRRPRPGDAAPSCSRCWRPRWSARPARPTISPTACRARCGSAPPGCAGRCGPGRPG